MSKRLKKPIDLTAESLGITTLHLQALFADYGIHGGFFWEEIPNEHLDVLEKIKAFLEEVEPQEDVINSSEKAPKKEIFELVIDTSELQRKGYLGLTIKFI